jgi:hypothetical protein
VNWTFDRAARLESLIARALAMSRHLRSEAIDAPPGSAARLAYRGRLALVERRLARLRDLARWARRAARELQEVAGSQHPAGNTRPLSLPPTGYCLPATSPKEVA